MIHGPDLDWTPMAENKSFVMTLALVVVAGSMMGMMAFGLTGKGQSGSGAPAAAAGGPVPGAPKPSAADVATQPESPEAPPPTDASTDGHPAAKTGPALEPYDPNKPPAVDPPGPPEDQGTTDATPQ